MYEKRIENPVELIGKIENIAIFLNEYNDIFYLVVSNDDIEFFIIGDTFDSDEMEVVPVDEADVELKKKIKDFVNG